MIKLKKNTLRATFRNKLLWPLLVYLTLTSFTVFLLVSMWNYFVSNPTVTSLDSTVYPVTKVPYPGISLCNINKISKRRARDLADFISKKTGENSEEIMKSIKVLGNLYDSNYDDSYKARIESFQKVLDKLQLQIRTLMRTLITPCEEFLQSCSWEGFAVNCSDIFELRLTFEGYCCTFNYVKNTSEWWMRRDKKKELVVEQGEPGQKSGLSVVINNDPDDYFFTVMSSAGINVHVFVPSDYPDKSSGNLIEIIADIGSENFFELIPTTVTAVRDVMNYDVNKRGCLFDAEQQTQFGVYSQSDCFVDCRVNSMLNLCECIPFTIPFSDESNICTLLDLPCLNKYKSKWDTIMPQDLEDLGMTEQEEGLFCRHTCYPSCEGTLYAVAPSSVQFFDSESQNDTGIHIFYRNRFHNLYRQDVVHYWFEIMSNYGGLFGLILGISFLSLIQGGIYCAKLVATKC